MLHFVAQFLSIFYPYLFLMPRIMVHHWITVSHWGGGHRGNSQLGSHHRQGASRSQDGDGEWKRKDEMAQIEAESGAPPEGSRLQCGRLKKWPFPTQTNSGDPFFDPFRGSRPRLWKIKPSESVALRILEPLRCNVMPAAPKQNQTHPKMNIA